MKSICEKLKKDIKKTSYRRYKYGFQPKDLGLKSSDYGAFSDHCKKGTTKSSVWCGCGLLECVNKKPFKYFLKK